MKDLSKHLPLASGFIVLSLLLFYFFFLNHVSLNEIGVAYNSVNGKITIQSQPGWYVTSPLTKVANISTIPFRVSAGLNYSSNVINDKIVRFKPEGIDDFLKLQGFGYYLNFNIIMESYAYSNQKYSFLEILQQAGQENVTNIEDEVDKKK